MTTIYLIRHAQAEGNVFRRMHGHYDSLLTPCGQAQVECLAKRFSDIPIDACFSSDLTRTCLTARAIYEPKGLPLRRDPRFREVGLGKWEDVPFAWLELFDETSRLQFDADPASWQSDGAETFEICTRRMIRGLEDAAKEYDGGTIAVFSHGSITRWVLMRLFFGDDASKLRFGENTAVCKLFYRDGQFSYEYLNDASHIPPELSAKKLHRWWHESGKKQEAGIYFRDPEHVADLALPDPVPGGKVTAAIMMEKPVGYLSVGPARDGVGEILEMKLLPGYEGRYYGDQLLGEAVSNFRKMGCTQVHAAPGDYPDDVLNRYGFSPDTREKSIDTKIFHWPM